MDLASSGSSSIDNGVVEKKCIFNGQDYTEGAAVTAYLSSNVPAGGTCISEERTCVDGAFSGSYVYSTCSVNAPAACLFAGQTIAHGASTIAYLNSSVSYEGGGCQSETRLCTNGSLSGSYNYQSCSVGAPASCLFNGQTVAHGATVRGFQNSTVAFGSACAFEDRSCNNGVLSGSYQFGSCAVGSPSSCLFNGQTVAHGQTLAAYQDSSVVFGQACIVQQRSCNNGALSGTYAFGSCSVGNPSSCLFNGQTVTHGQTVTAYQYSSVAFGQTCGMQQRTCNNGVLSGNYSYGTCTVGNPNSCLFNGQTVAHGQNVTGYLATSVAYNQTCASEQRSCNNGVLTGTYAYGSCAPVAPSSCNFNGQTVPHNSSVLAYQASSVPYGGSCVSQARTCQNGVLSGTYTASSCSVPSCSPNVGQACLKDMIIYWQSPKYSDGSQCSIAMGNVGFQNPCPAAPAGYTWALKQCGSDSYPTNGVWMQRFECMAGRPGTFSCAGVCQ